MRLNCLTSETLIHIEQMVLWGVNKKMIASLSPVEKIETVVRDLYRRAERRPPSGMSGSAVGAGLSIQDLKGFSCLTSTYGLLRTGHGMTSSQASLAAYGAYRDVWPERLKTCNPNVWFGFTRDFEAGNAGLYFCELCAGPHIWQQGVYRVFKKCLWCESRLRMPQPAVDAAWAADATRTVLDRRNGNLFG